MIMCDSRFNTLDRIKSLARQKLSKKFRCNHLAVIFKGNSILAIGENSHKTHPKTQIYGYPSFCKIHAELSACIRFGKEDCSKYSIAVVRIDRNGKFNQSRPCPGCQNVLRQLNFRKIYFTNETGNWEKLC